MPGQRSPHTRVKKFQANSLGILDILYGVVEKNGIIFKEIFKAWGIPSSSPCLFTWIFKTFMD